MKNVTHEIIGDELVIRIKVSTEAVKDASVSKSGRSKLIASTNGLHEIEYDGISFHLGLNLILPKKKRKQKLSAESAWD